MSGTSYPKMPYLHVVCETCAIVKNEHVFVYYTLRPSIQMVFNYLILSGDQKDGKQAVERGVKM